MKDYSLEDLKNKYDKNEIRSVAYSEILTKDSKEVTSQVWEQFNRLLDTVTKIIVLSYVICTHCESFVHFNGSTTTALWRHKKICPANSNDNKRARIDFKSEDLVPLRNAAAKFVCLDFRPAFAVEGKGLCEYIYTCIQLAKKYPNMMFNDLLRAMPSRNTVTTHIQSLASETIVSVSQMLQEAITECGCIKITSDLWTDKMNSTPFITITAHFFVLTATALQLKSLVIELREMAYERMTGPNIKEAIVDSFAQFGIHMEHLLNNACFVTDRGGNMLSAVKDFESHACLAHLCNNVVKEMLDVAEVKKIVTNASSLVKYIKASHIGSQLTYKLKSHIETRWNSTYDMMMSIIENYQEVFHLLQTKDSNQGSNVLDRLTCLPMNEMKAICQLLVFFKNVTSLVEGEKYVTLHNYWLTIREMKKILKINRSDTDLVKAMKNAALRYIQSSESSGSFQISHRHKMAVFLHPQAKGLSFANASEKREIHSHMKELIEMANNNNDTTEDDQMTGAASEQVTSYSLFQSYFDKSSDADDNELERYIVAQIEPVIKSSNLGATCDKKGVCISTYYTPMITYSCFKIKVITIISSK